MTRPRLTATTIAALLAAALIAGAAAPAAATHDGGDEGGIADALTPDDDGFVASSLGYVGGLTDRASYAVFGADDSADENRDAMIETFNAHNDSLVEYANARDIHQGEVLRVDCELEGESATAYIVADYNTTGDEYESAKAVTETERSVDHEVTLRKNACDNAAEEIETFHDKFAATGDNVTNSYLTGMAGEYGSNVDEPFTGSDD